MGDEALARRELGVVKWIGGFNKKKNRENDFGFIESIEGEDIFVHKSSLVDAVPVGEGDKVSFICEPSDRGQKALDVRLVPFTINGLPELFLKLGEVQSSTKSAVYLAYQRDAEQALFSSPPETRNQIVQQLFDDESGRLLLDRFFNQTAVYQELLQIFDLEALIDRGVSLDALPIELVRKNEEAICRFICSGRLTSVSKQFLDRTSPHVLYACALVNLLDNRLLQGREVQLYAYLHEKFVNPDGAKAALYQDIFSHCTKRLGGHQASPLVWDMLSELLLKKYLFDRDFRKAESLYLSPARLSQKLDCFILFNLAQLLVSGNDLQTTYNIFVHMLWQAMATKQLDVESQATRILSLFPSCGTIRLSDVSAIENPENRNRETRLSCEAVYWEKTQMYLCRGSVCSTPQIRPNATRNFLDFSIYDWFVHFGVEFWGSEDHRLRDFPIKLAGYLNRLREIMPHLRCRSCDDLMLPDFKYSRVKCSVLENGIQVEKDMAAAYRNTVFYCNNANCSEHSKKYYINHCLGYLCFDLIDSRDLKVKCDGGKLVCKGCGGCCGEHAKSNPIGLCSECGSPLELYEDPDQRSRFGRRERFVQCSNSKCSFEITEPGLPKKFYLESSQPVHLVESHV